LKEKEKQELLKQINKLEFIEQYVSDNLAKAIREYEDR
jgi:hypothetical protein